MEKLDTNIFNGLIKEGQSVLVGVSGGADSMCLLTLLARLREKKNIRLLAAHVNHGIRGEEAARDQHLVENYAKQLKVDLRIIKVDVPAYCKKEGTTIEEGARILRYKAFDKILKDEKIDLLAVAHNQGDQAETILMHLLRGGAIRGMKGMTQASPKLIRPFINVSREEIEEFDNKNNVPFIVDSTNNDISYTRNYVRSEVLPRLEKIYPGAKRALLNFANLARRDDEYIESQVPYELLKAKKNEVRIDERVKTLPLSLSTRLVLRATTMLSVEKDIEQKHIEAVLALFKKKSGSRVDLVHNLVAHRDYDCVTLEKNLAENSNFEVDFGIKTIDFANFGEICVEKAQNFVDFMQNEKIHYIDKGKVPSGAVWRTFRAGDYFCPVNSKRKKLSDYFTDKKVEKRKREKLPVLASGNEVLVVATLGISEKVKIDSTTKNAYRIKYQ